MATYKAVYTVSFCIEIEADSYEEAMEIQYGFYNDDITQGQKLEDCELVLDYLEKIKE